MFHTVLIFIETTVLMNRRKNLHKYDPEDLQSSFNMERTPQEQPNQNDQGMTPLLTSSTSKTMTVQGQQLAEASSKGLLVDIQSSSMQNGDMINEEIMESDNMVKKEIGASKIDVWENELGDGCADDFFIEEDSDDDLL